MSDIIGLIGLGLVGSGLAKRLLDRGFKVIGYDVDAGKAQHLVALGGRAAQGPSAVAAESSRVVLSLMTSQIAREVLEGPRGVLEADPLPTHVVDTTTGDPEDAVALADRLGRQGVGYLDATVSGSSRLIRDGEGVFMVGGRAEDFESCRDLFAAFSSRVIHIGPSGCGSKAKLASNLILGLNRAALAEGLVFAERLGLSLPAFLELIRISPAYSRAVDDKGVKMISGDFTPEARLSQHQKDLSMILASSARLGQELPLTRTHSDLLQGAIEAGDGDLDNSAVISEIRRRYFSRP